MKGFYMNELTDELLSGRKKLESRNRNTLHSLVGERVFIIKTGVGIVGSCRLGHPIIISSQAQYESYRPFTMVAPGSRYDYTGGKKYLYPVYDPIQYPVAVKIPERAVRHGRVWIEV